MHSRNKVAESLRDSCFKNIVQALFGVLACGVSNAELPQPLLQTVFPAGGQAGQAVEVKITGTDIDEAALRFTVPGITAKRDEKDKKKFSLSIASEVKPGRYDVRVVNTLGVSNPRVFEVSDVPEVLEAKNDKRETAQESPLPCIINGTAGSQQDDWFKLMVKKGEPFRVQCFARELDSKMVPQLTLFDSKGEELLNERATSRIDGVASDDGPLLLRLNDLIYKGGAEFVYRLRLDREATITPGLTAEPDLLKAITLPCVEDGKFGQRHRTIRFSFAAKKGDVWWIDVHSQRLGMATNPRAVVQRIDKDKRTDVLELNDGPVVPGLPDYDGNHLDPTGRLEIKEDGQYELLLTNLSTWVARSCSYRLEIRKPKPDFALVAIPVPPVEDKPGKDFNGAVVKVWNHNLHRGETMPVRIIVERCDGFDGDINVHADALPNGVTSNEITIGKDVSDTMLCLSCDEKAMAAATPIRVTGTAGDRKHEARGTTTLWNMGVNEFIEPSRWRFTDEIMLGVVEEPVVPVTVQVETKEIEAKKDDKVKLRFIATRRSDYKAAIKLKPAGVNNASKLKDAEIAENAATVEYELDVAALKIKEGVFNLWFKGDAKVKVNGKDTTADVFAGPVTLRVK